MGKAYEVTLEAIADELLVLNYSFAGEVKLVKQVSKGL